MAHPTAVERIEGWKGIARYLGRDVTTAIRWERQKGLPVYRVPGGKRQAVFCYAHELDAWLHPEKGDSAAANAVGSVIIDDLPLEETDLSPTNKLALSRAGFPGNPFRSGTLWVVIVAGVFLAAALAAFLTLIWPHNVRLWDERQITNDGAIKSNLVTDGRTLYMSEWRDGRTVVASVSVQGGPVREIPTPFTQTFPLAVSRDGRNLLALDGEGEEQEKALWVVPVAGAAPRRVGSLLCHAAAWSPDEREIAYSFGNAVYLATPDGKPEIQLYAFTTTPQELRWSIDGRRLFVRLRDSSTWDSSIWQLVLRSDHHAVTSIRPLVATPRDYDSISPILDRDDDFFVATGGEPSNIFLVRQSRFPWISGTTVTSVANMPTQSDDFALDPSTRKLYFLRDHAARNELNRFDPKSRTFHLFLPGVSARDVEFSRDGRQIAYVQIPENTLWIADSSGRSARRILTPGMTNIELPRWSPDGRQIAFMARRSNEPYRIFIAATGGGTITQASHGTDNQGAPTWSPDGRHLVYGRVLCQEEKTCAILEINLVTGEQTTIPGSEGLSTARWSPDGRFIAALRADKHEVWLLDRSSGAWRKLAQGVNGNDLAWSRDSRSLYASCPEGEHPGLVRIGLGTGAVAEVADLTDFSKLNGRVDTWFAVTPDDSFIFMRIVAGHEVYSLSYQ